MLKLLLDEHISPAVANGVRRRNRTLTVFCMASWEDGAFLGQPDSVGLEEAVARGLTLITYDRRTIPRLLKDWAEQQRSHGGVIFVDEETISPADTGAIVDALSELVRRTARWDSTNRVSFLRR